MDKLELKIKTETIAVEKYLLGVDSVVPAQVLCDLAAHHQDHVLRHATLHLATPAVIEPMLDRVFIHLRTYLLKNMQAEKTALSVSTPKTWFDHLKYDMLTSGKPWQMWLVKNFSPKVNMKIETKELEIVRVCPHDDSYLSENTQHLHFLLWGDNGNRLE